MSRTLFDKIWEQHTVRSLHDRQIVLYIDRHLIHEVTSPQAFSGLERRGLPVFRPERTIATADHNVPTLDQHLPISDQLSRIQVDTLTANCQRHGIELFGLGHPHQGIVHVIGPELGLTQPGMTIVCGDSHTSTHGAFGAIAFGIGTSEVEMVLATQTLIQSRPRQMRIVIDGVLSRGVTSKDIVLHIISRIGTGGATGHFIEYAGETIRSLSMEARMTICNMSIEMGARGGIIAPDDETFRFVRGRSYAPAGDAWTHAVKEWKTLYSDPGAFFDREIAFRAEEIEPMITYGTNPGMGMPINGRVPLSGVSPENAERDSFRKSLEYMGLQEGQALLGMPVQHVFIGSCTNSRIEDFRQAAEIIRGRTKHGSIHALIVPGSRQVARQLREEGLDKIFESAGFVLRQPGCSACLAMNDDKIPAGDFCVSTSNRNFEGRQGVGARTLLASPLTAAAASITGVITDARDFMN